MVACMGSKGFEGFGNIAPAVLLPRRGARQAKIGTGPCLVDRRLRNVEILCSSSSTVVGGYHRPRRQHDNHGQPERTAVEAITRRDPREVPLPRPPHRPYVAASFPARRCSAQESRIRAARDVRSASGSGAVSGVLIRHQTTLNNRTTDQAFCGAHNSATAASKPSSVN